MADRNFQKKKRNDVKRKRKPVMIFTGEGKNKTEKQYFLSFQEQHGKYSIQFVNTGFDTDPAGMLKSMESAWKRYELSAKDGDKAYIVLDMDCNPKKIKLVKELQSSSKNIQFIASNPCIEVWFILHFVYTTHQFKDSKEPKHELAKYISEYEENMNVSGILRPRLQEADKNVKKLMAHYASIGVKWGEVDCNPMTDVTEILKELDVI
ncbi:MAG: RloB family protein [Lachnospiraceae bacterium]|nr:RloB family protein [Lachnospiraceae bacterium]